MTARERLRRAKSILDEKVTMIRTCFLLLVCIGMASPLGCTRALSAKPCSTPVILDTDIGIDIDDTWALALLLASPELDLKLVVTDSHDTVGKAKLAAKFLQCVGRSDIPVGIGLKQDDEIGALGPWGNDYDLAGYPGTIHNDGIQAMIDVIMNSPTPVTLIAIGPVPNLTEALRREPRIAERARLIVMGGSVDRQYNNKPGRCAEYNVAQAIKAAQVAYMAGWDVTMAPLDVAESVVLAFENYARVRDADQPLAKTLMENYRIWAKAHPQRDPDRKSSILYDTVAIYLAFDASLCDMRDIRLRVTDEGMTEPHGQGKLIHVAVAWKDLDGFYSMLADRIAGYGINRGVTVNGPQKWGQAPPE